MAGQRGTLDAQCVVRTSYTPMPDKTVPSVGCDIYLSGAWFAFRDRKMHAIELGNQLRARSGGEVKILDRETGDVIIIQEDGQLHYVGVDPAVYSSIPTEP